MIIGSLVVIAILVLGYFAIALAEKHAPAWAPTVMWARDLAFLVAVTAYFGGVVAIVALLVIASITALVIYVSLQGETS